MSLARHCRFCIELPAALWHWARELYYRVALNHVGHDHPESWLITHRMLDSRLRVNDFLRKWT